MKNLIYLLALLLPFGAYAQDKPKNWSLEDCIQHAIDHNINIKQQELQKENAEIALNTNQMSRLPNLNAGVGQNWSFGRTNNNSLGVYEDRTISNTSLNISSSTPLFTGFQIPNQIAKSKFNLKASIENLERAKEDLALNIASLYLKVLLNKELLKISEELLIFSKQQVEKTKLLVEVEKVPRSQLFDIEAQVAKDEVSVVQSKNNLALSLLDLAQSLELEHSSEFDIIEPITGDVIAEYMSSVLPPSVIYDRALLVKPVVKEQEYLLESSKKDLKIAEAGYMPKLSLNLSYNNSYFYDYNSDNIAFRDQFKNNGGESIGLSLSIPIFNRFQVRNQVRSARLDIQDRQFYLDNVKKNLFKEIQTAYLNATASQEKYRSAGRSVIASAESFKYARERYDAGKSTVFEFNEARTKLDQSQSELIQAKYDYIFCTKILDFYNGMPIKL